MAIFSQNRYDSIGSTGPEVEMAEGYYGETGAALALIEGYENDIAIFNGAIMNDFEEVCRIHEGATLEEVLPVMEGALTSAWAKIKEFFTKLLSKIKGILTTFIKKFDSIFMRDATKYYNKYAKTLESANLTGFTCKWAQPKELITVAADFDSTITVNNKGSLDDVETTLSEWDTDVEFGKTAAKLLDGKLPEKVTAATFDSEYAKASFDEPTDKSWTSAEIISGEFIGNVMKNSKFLSDLKDDNKKLEDGIKKIIAQITTAEKEIGKLKSGEDSKDTYKTGNFKADGSNEGNATFTGGAEDSIKYGQKIIALCNKEAAVLQSVILKYTAASVKTYKEIAAQARRVFSAAVAFKPAKDAAVADAKEAEKAPEKKEEPTTGTTDAATTESALILANAIGESAYYDAMDLLDTMQEFYVEGEEEGGNE